MPRGLQKHSCLTVSQQKYFAPKGRRDWLERRAQEVVQAAISKHPHHEGREARGRVAAEQGRPLQVRRHRGLDHRRHDIPSREHQGYDSRSVEEGVLTHHSSEPAQQVNEKENMVDKRLCLSVPPQKRTQTCKKSADVLSVSPLSSERKAGNPDLSTKILSNLSEVSKGKIVQREDESCSCYKSRTTDPPRKLMIYLRSMF